MEIKMNQRKLALILLVAASGLMLGVFMMPTQDNRKPQDVRGDIIERQFSSYDGSHKAFTEYIKQTMNDPDSYKFVESRYWDMGKFIIVEQTFRGTNAFGGVVTTRLQAKVGLSGDIIAVGDDLLSTAREDQVLDDMVNKK